MKQRNRKGFVIALAISVCLVGVTFTKALFAIKAMDLPGNMMVLPFIPVFFLAALCLFLCLGHRWARILLLFLCGLSLAGSAVTAFARPGVVPINYWIVGLNFLFIAGITAALAFSRPLTEYTNHT